jgi:hypothetical protein
MVFLYTDGVKRLIQLGTIALVLAAFLTPLLEFFDQWDPPGPSNDSEMAVFGFFLVLCLVLIVCRLTAALAHVISLVLIPYLGQNRGSPLPSSYLFVYYVAPQVSPPLRI